MTTLLILGTLLLSCASSTYSESNKFVLSSLTTTTKIYLTKNNFDDITANKTVFIKWAAPWCGHSQELAPAWDQLVSSNFTQNERPQDDAVSSKSIPHHFPLLIAEVDCAKEADWCAEMGYTAYPTLTFGDPSLQGRYMQTYDSLNKDYQSLRQFVTSTLLSQSFCTPGNYLVKGRCSAEEIHRIQMYFDMPVPKLRSSIQWEEEMIKAAEDSFHRATDEMQARYDATSKGFEATKANIKRQLKFMRRILQQKH
jgi:thiol-disulfide isomerase/thioredoxin